MRHGGLRPEMTIKRLPRPRDPAPRAKFIVDIATGEVEDRVEGRDGLASNELRQKWQRQRVSSISVFINQPGIR